MPLWTRALHTTQCIFTGRQLGFIYKSPAQILMFANSGGHVKAYVTTPDQLLPNSSSAHGSLLIFPVCHLSVWVRVWVTWPNDHHSLVQVQKEPEIPGVFLSFTLPVILIYVNRKKMQDFFLTTFYPIKYPFSMDQLVVNFFSLTHCSKFLPFHANPLTKVSDPV